MSAYEQFMAAMLFVLVVGAAVAHFIDRRRQRSIAEFERKRRDRKAEVERAARKAL